MLKTINFTNCSSVLRQQLPHTDKEDFAVVHGDVNHRNWLVCKNYLYLVDWDSIMFADPAVDLATIFRGIMYRCLIGISGLSVMASGPTDEILEKLHWYAAMNLLQEITRYCKRDDHRRMNEEIYS